MTRIWTRHDKYKKSYLVDILNNNLTMQICMKRTVYISLQIWFDKLIKYLFCCLYDKTIDAYLTIIIQYNLIFFYIALNFQLEEVGLRIYRSRSSTSCLYTSVVFILHFSIITTITPIISSIFIFTVQHSNLYIIVYLTTAL